MKQKATLFSFILATIIAGIVFVVTGQTAPCFAQDSPPSESDSAILERHKHEVRVEYALEEFSDHSFNAHYSDDDLDSMMNESRTSIQGAHMYYAPDSSFKIAVIEMEGCGAYCNPWWESWLHFNDGSSLVINDAGFEEITGIYALPDGKYLIMETDHGRSGVYGCYSYFARVVSLDNHRVVYHRIPGNTSEDKENSYDALSVYSCTYSMDECKLDYDQNKKTLSYFYDEDILALGEPDSVTVYSGVYVYPDTSFVLQKSEEHRVKYEMN